MNVEQAMKIIVKPYITEKTFAMIENENKISFRNFTHHPTTSVLQQHGIRRKTRQFNQRVCYGKHHLRRHINEYHVYVQSQKP